MEDIADAIEDAQYVRAVDDGPRPEIHWNEPTVEELAEWKGKVMENWQKLPEKDDVPKPFTYEWVLSSPLSFFLFTSFLKECENDFLQINFVEEVIRWRYLRGRPKNKKAIEIINLYIQGTTTNQSKDEKILPEKTEINEFDIERKTKPGELNGEEFLKMANENIDESCSKCCIGLDGSVRNEILKHLPLLEASAKRVSMGHGHNNDSSKFSQNNMTSADLNTDKAHLTNETKLEKPGSSNDEDQEQPRYDEKAASFKENGKKVPKNIFDNAERILLETIRRKYWETFISNTQHWQKLMKFLWFQDRKVEPDDFFIMRVLGRGGFGLVSACKKGVSGKLYAVKKMNKKRIKIKKAEQLTINERSALSALNSPFVVNLKYSFQSNEDIFLVLDLMTGGDLSFHLSQKGRFNSAECLYYAARIALGLQALHDKNYVYRDLKPENCLLAEDGRVKLTDLGLATKITPNLQGAAGTRGYWAPEMLTKDKYGKRQSYDQMVDWFSYGCVVAEFLSGKNPFRTETALNFGMEKGEKKTKEKAIDYATLEMNPEMKMKYFTEISANFCLRLLDKNPKTRLGAGGIEEIMDHAFFESINWEMIISDRKNPPFVPAKDVNAASQSDIGTFADDKGNDTVLDEKDNSVYADWDWTNPKAYSAEVIEFLIYERETGQPLLPPSHGDACCCNIL